MVKYTLDENFNLVPSRGSGTQKKLLGRTLKLEAPKMNVTDEIKKYEQSGKILKGGFLFDLLATGANMIKNGVQGRRWSDNTAFKGLGKGKNCDCLDEVVEFERTGSIKKGGFLLDFLATGINMIKNGIEGKKWNRNTVFQGLGKTSKPKTKRVATPAQKKRGAMVKKVMKDYGVSLPEASKMIKEAGL